MVRRAGTMLRACGCEHVPHEGGIQLGGKSRGRTIRLGSRRLLAVNLLDQVQLYVEVGRPKLHFPCKRSTCQCQGRRSQSVSKAWQRGRDMTKYSTTASLAHRYSSTPWVSGYTRHLEAAYPSRPPCASPGINLRENGLQSRLPLLPFSDLEERPM